MGLRKERRNLRSRELSERDHDESEKNRGSEEHGDDDSCDGTGPQHDWKQKYINETKFFLWKTLYNDI